MFNEDEIVSTAYQILDKRKLLLRYIESGDEGALEKIGRIENDLLKEAAPLNFRHDDQGNVIRRHEKDFATTCCVLEEAGISEPGRLSVVDFFTRIEYLESKAKKKTK